MLERNKPFERQHLSDDPENPNKDRNILTVSLNPTEYELIQKYKKLWDTESDGKILKNLAEIGSNVILTLFGESMMQWLASPKRVRTKKYTVKNGEIVIQKNEDK